MSELISDDDDETVIWVSAAVIFNGLLHWCFGDGRSWCLFVCHFAVAFRPLSSVSQCLVGITESWAAAISVIRSTHN